MIFTDKILEIASYLRACSDTTFDNLKNFFRDGQNDDLIVIAVEIRQ
jgi:hypothetical protein